MQFFTGILVGRENGEESKLLGLINYSTLEEARDNLVDSVFFHNEVGNVPEFATLHKCDLDGGSEEVESLSIDDIIADDN